MYDSAFGQKWITIMKNSPSQHTTAPLLLNSQKIDPEFVPEEIWGIILSKFTPQNLAQFTLSSHFFHRLAEDTVLWKNLIRYYFPYLEKVAPDKLNENPR